MCFGMRAGVVEGMCTCVFWHACRCVGRNVHVCVCVCVSRLLVTQTKRRQLQVLLGTCARAVSCSCGGMEAGAAGAARCSQPGVGLTPEQWPYNAS